MNALERLGYPPRGHGCMYADGYYGARMYLVKVQVYELMIIAGHQPDPYQLPENTMLHCSGMLQHVYLGVWGPVFPKAL